MVRIGVFGARGRMGREIIKVLSESDEASLSAAFERPGHPEVGSFIDNVKILSDEEFSPELADVFVDFTNPSASISHVDKCSKAGVPIVVGTTGFSKDEEEFIRDSSRTSPILLSPNMSFGVNVLFELVRFAAKVLKNYDVEIFEAHHRHKKDSPSGTALRIGRIVAEVWGKSIEDVELYRTRGITGERPEGAIGFSSLRAGEIVGDHKVYFCGPGECVELSHRAISRRAFAVGAVKAAVWLSDKSPGLYSMKDVLGISL